jgi:hypothetical protein
MEPVTVDLNLGSVDLSDWSNRTVRFTPCDPRKPTPKPLPGFKRVLIGNGYVVDEQLLHRGKSPC